MPAATRGLPTRDHGADAAGPAVLPFPTPTAASWLARHDALVGAALWLVLITVIAGLQAVGDHKSVTGAYARGGHGWLQGTDLYDGSGHGFIYLPISGLLFIPLAAHPGVATEVAWRLFTIGSFAAGCWFCGRLLERRFRRPAFAALSAAAVILGFPAARNGQATLPMAALLMIAVFATVKGRHLLAAVTALAAILLKPLTVPVIVVLAIIRPRILPGLLLGSVLLIGMPYLVASPTWVNRQNAGFLEVLRVSQRMQSHEAWATFFGMVNVLFTSPPAPLRTLVQVAAAVGATVGCRLALRRLDSEAATLHIYTLTMTLLLLFSPRTENNTYACLAPAIVALMAAATPAAPAGLLPVVAGWTAVIAIVGSYELGRLILPEVRGVWLAPLATTLLTPWFVGRLSHDLRSPAEERLVVPLPRPAVERKAA